MEYMLPNALALTPGKLLVEYGGYLYLYRAADGRAELADTFDLVSLFLNHSSYQRELESRLVSFQSQKQTTACDQLDFTSSIWVQAGGDLLAVNNGYLPLFSILTARPPPVCWVSTSSMADS